VQQRDCGTVAVFKLQGNRYIGTEHWLKQSKLFFVVPAQDLLNAFPRLE
jgi:hypothetical protein